MAHLRYTGNRKNMSIAGFGPFPKGEWKEVPESLAREFGGLEDWEVKREKIVKDTMLRPDKTIKKEVKKED